MAETTRQINLHRPALWLALTVALALAAPAARAQSAADTELQMKAGFIYNFALFAEWPAGSFKDDAAPLSVCIAGPASLLPAFEALKAKQLRGRPVAVAPAGDNPSRGPCHIVYIPHADKAAAAQALKNAAGPGVLTIGDAPDFARQGGIIGFYREGNKLRFEINTDAAARAGLKLSSQLLKLARIVTGEAPR